MLDKTFRPDEVEDRIYDQWEKSGAFRPGRDGAAPPYAIVIPPPNVTGSLHVGHALNNMLQDGLVRFERMRGKDVLWQPGTDHAGIATQLVVERRLTLRQENRKRMGREKFLTEVWSWKEESGGTIVKQLRKLGASADWSRERFTMDEGLSHAVLKVFVQLHKEGLIYKDKRLVNWDPSLQTAVSDLEVESVEIKGKLWHLKYPIDGTDEFIIVATSRPETMLGDTAVAVHPEDARYAHLVGKRVRLPLTDRLIPILADEYSDPEKGSGAVKITPAHDFNDFEVGRRHSLPLINIFTVEARLNDNAPVAYRGLDRFEVRKRVVTDLEALGLIEKIEDIVHAVPHDEKTKSVVLEPYMTEQWYLNVQPLAEKAIKAVEDGRTRFVPEQWTNVYYSWMRNIQPWCISRQLWWGHQIPAWYGPDGHVFVEMTEGEAAAAATAHFGKPVALRRDEDVLDTWFSSALWPFSTLGWPEKTPELARYYPTSVLVTAFDIIFFWVARMMMMGLHFMGDVPFRDVFIHNRVLDEKGQKMSKTKGNVVDPLDIIKEYGTDALRFALAIAAGQGKDIRLGLGRVETCRNFATKLWNAARFCEMNQCVRQSDFNAATAKETVNRWIIGETKNVAAEVTRGLESYRFNDAAGAIYHFVYDVFCDWYLEFSKPILNGTDEAAKAESRATAAFVRDQILALLHPFMPFITEELWARTAEGAVPRGGLLMQSEWPTLADITVDEAAAAEMQWLIALITGVRSVRAEMNVPPSARMPLLIKGAGPQTKERLIRHQGLLLTLARLSEATEADSFPKGSAQFVVGEAGAALPLGDVIDIAKERARLEKDVVKTEAEIVRLNAKLENQGFVAKAPPEVIEEQKERRGEAMALKAKLQEALARLQ